MTARPSAWFLTALFALTGSCRSREAAPSASATPSAVVPAPAVSRRPAPAGPQSLLFLPTSAYQASIAMDDDAVYVLTGTAVHRIVVGQTTVSFPRELGSAAVLTSHGIAFWSKGKLFEAPKTAGEPRVLGSVPRSPQRLAASGERLAWIDSAAGKLSVQTLDVDQPRQLYAAAGALDAIAMLGDDVFFVERLSPTAWHIGRVGVQGGEPSFTAEKRGRSPSQLVGFGDALHFQDPSGYRVLELSRGLGHERVLARDLVCSPLAVWEQVYCAQVEGLVQVPGGGRPPRLLAPNARGLITAMAANSSAIAWISDAGPDQLTVKLLTRNP